MEKTNKKISKEDIDFIDEFTLKLLASSLKEQIKYKELIRNKKLIKFSLCLKQKVYFKYKGEFIDGEVVSLMYEDDLVKYKIKYYKKNIPFPYYLTFFEEDIDDFIFTDREMAKDNTEMRWIDINSRKPAENVVVETLTLSSNGNYPPIIAKLFYKDRIWFSLSGSEYDEPTHWRYIVEE